VFVLILFLSVFGRKK